MKTEQSNNKGFFAGLVAGAAVGVATLASFVFPSRDTVEDKSSKEKPAVTRPAEELKPEVIVIRDLPPIEKESKTLNNGTNYLERTPATNLDLSQSSNINAPKIISNESPQITFKPTNYLNTTPKNSDIDYNHQDFPRLGFSYFSKLDNERNFEATFQLNKLSFPASITLSSNLDSSVTALAINSELKNGELQIKAIFDNENNNAIVTGNYSGRILDFEFGKLYQLNGKTVDSSAYFKALLENPNDPSFKASINYEDYLGNKNWTGTIQKERQLGDGSVIFRAGFSGSNIQELNQGPNTSGVFQLEIMR
jgi:hypothetical protein